MIKNAPLAAAIGIALFGIAQSAPANAQCASAIIHNGNYCCNATYSKDTVTCDFTTGQEYYTASFHTICRCSSNIIAAHLQELPASCSCD
jgi:hypothetical protein